MLNVNRISGILLFALLLFLYGVSCSTDPVTPRVLVFSKTAGFRHKAIANGLEAIMKMSEKHGFIADTTENASAFNEENLRNYHAVIFLNTTGNILNKQQQNDFERFIQAGGGFVGVHAAADTEYDWPWYNGLVGAYFDSHPNNPNVRTAEFFVTKANHPATDSLPERFTRTDEFYNFRSIQDDIQVLVKIDEDSYEGGTNQGNHPMSWYHEYDGGRAFYTAMGHTPESYTEPLFLHHLWGGLQYVLGKEKNPVTLDFKQAYTVRVPDENRFTKIVLDERLDEPMELAVMNDNRVLFIERKGAIKLYDPKTEATQVIYTMPISHRYLNKDGDQSEAEDGLLGMALDPQFDTNHWLYLYYSQSGEEPVNILTRWEFRDDKLIESSRKVILKVPVQRDQCCHTGGSIDFDSKGNLYLSTGDNTSPRSTPYSPIDERPGRMPWDAQKGSANTNDLRGKIIRIHPEPDGTYTIPEGNMFPKGMEKTRPEIYGMGMRNPFRISVDRKTGYVYWGDVGPDASSDSSQRGPRGFDEINQLRKPGYYGWPYFIGDNKPYYDYDFATGKSGALFNPEKPINNSPNNTGLTELPPAQPAFIWYPYGPSGEFPLLGVGGRTAMAGPVFYADKFKGAKRAFPAYFDGKLFIYEWIRGWIILITMDEEGNYKEMERFMPSQTFSNPMDMEFGPDGDLYMLEYGTGWFQQNNNARLIRIEYNGGNRKPEVQLAASKQKGKAPLLVNFSSTGTRDFDRDALTYRWVIQSNDGKTIRTINTPEVSYTFEKTGVYKAILTVTDEKGASAMAEKEILVGNEPPVISVDITEGNKSFFFPGIPFKYKVNVLDQEDGSLEDGKLSPETVSVTIDYLKEGFDKVEVVQGHLAADAFATGRSLVADGDCKACHQESAKSVGPAYVEVAKKYRNDAGAVEYLAKKIIEGGSGVWGDVAMAAHPTLTTQQASQIVKYILSLGDKKESPSVPVEGSYTIPKPENREETMRGAVIIRAAYEDKGANGIPPIRQEHVRILKAPALGAVDIDQSKGVVVTSLNNLPMDIMTGTIHSSYIVFKQIDLSGIDEISIMAAAFERSDHVGGTLELHLDTPEGTLTGTSKPVMPDNTRKPVRSAFAITPTEGVHDLYFVYTNPKIPTKKLFTVMRIGFHLRD